MDVQIRKVTTKKELKSFIRFNYEFYRGNPYAVPDLYEDMLDTFSPEKNPAFEFCEADYFLAYDENNEILGRVAAIINHRANETWNKRTVRFGWIDFVDDLRVCKALIDTVKAWGKERGMDEMEGPLGFTDMDAEGMLIEGFDQLSTMATIYNYPYYPELIEQLGFEKAIDWIEMKLFVPEKMPEKYMRVGEIVKTRFNLHIRKIKNQREIRKENLGQKIFDLVNAAYKPLYGYSEMTQRQIDSYVKTYLPLIDLRMVTLVENEENEIVGVGITMPSLSRALQKARGRLWPFGWFYLAKALFIKHPKIVDLLLIAVRQDFRGKGVNALLLTDLIPIYRQMGIEYGETNPELEINEKVQSQWQYLDTEQHKRRRCFKMNI